MVSARSQNVIDRAKEMYDARWRAELEANQSGRFVAIEPESAEYFLADSFSQAVDQAHRAYPERISFVLHVGHDAAIHIGELRS